MSEARKAYPNDVSDDEWAFGAPYLTLMREDSPQREHALRDALDALRWLVRTGAQWQYLPHDVPPWSAVYQQARRWVSARCFEAIAHDLREVLHLAHGRGATPSAAIPDGRTVRSTPESGARAGYDGHTRTKGSKVLIAVDTLGHLLALTATAADAQERAQVTELAAAVQEATGHTVSLAYVDQGYTGDQPAADAAAHGIELEVVKRTEAKNGFVLLTRRWVVERSFAWFARPEGRGQEPGHQPIALDGLPRRVHPGPGPGTAARPVRRAVPAGQAARAGPRSAARTRLPGPDGRSGRGPPPRGRRRRPGASRAGKSRP